MALPIEDVATDIHCVTRWSKLGTCWRGVSLDTLLDHVETDADYSMVHSYGGYTTNVPMEDLRGGTAWVAFEFDGEPLDPEHGGPARLLVPHLYFWKSAKWVRGPHPDGRRRAGILGAERLQHARRPLDRRALLVIVGDWRAARVVEVAEATSTARVLRVHGARLAGERSGTARRHPPHRRGRLPGGALVLARARTAPDATIELAVDEIPDGEVSPYLVRDVLPGRRARGQGPARRLLRLATPGERSRCS